MTQEAPVPDVALFMPDLSGGGAEKVMLLLGREFLAAGLSVDLVVGGVRGAWTSELPRGLRLVDLRARRMAGMLVPLRRYLWEAKPRSLLVAMWPATSIAVAASVLASYRGRIVLTEHADFLSARPPLTRRELLAMEATMSVSHRYADCAVGVSTGVATTVARLAHMNSEKVSVVHNPIGPLDPFSQAVAEPIPGWSDFDGPRLLGIGRLAPQKDFPTLLRSLVLVRSRIGARLAILGEGPERPRLEGMIRDLGLSGAVFLPGFRHQSAAILKAADVFVLSSTWEGFGNVIVEAMAEGVQVVSTDCPSGPSEILEAGRFGRLVPIGDHSAMGEAVLSALERPLAPDSLTRRARDFAPPIAARRYIKLLGL